MNGLQVGLASVVTEGFISLPSFRLRRRQYTAGESSIPTGIDLDALVDAGAFISGVLGRPPVSRAGKALLTKREKAAA